MHTEFDPIDARDDFVHEAYCEIEFIGRIRPGSEGGAHESLFRFVAINHLRYRGLVKLNEIDPRALQCFTFAPEYPHNVVCQILASRIRLIREAFEPTGAR